MNGANNIISFANKIWLKQPVTFFSKSFYYHIKEKI